MLSIRIELLHSDAHYARHHALILRETELIALWAALLRELARDVTRKIRTGIRADKPSLHYRTSDTPTFANLYQALRHTRHRSINPANGGKPYRFFKCCDAPISSTRNRNPAIRLARQGRISHGRGRVDHEAEWREAKIFMCNLYSHTRSQDAMRGLFTDRNTVDRLGNLAPQEAIYPDQSAPIAYLEGDDIVLQRARWGMPSPKQFHSKSGIDRGVTNIRNTGSPHWRRWLKPENRCLVPLTSFAEPAGKGKGNAWFRIADGRPAMFAGLWVSEWTSIRKMKDGETTDDLYGFLTTEPNAEIAAVHPKAMPVILTEPTEWETWLTADWANAKAMQQPLPDGSLVRDE